MKKIILILVSLCSLFTISNRIHGQHCADLQADLDKAEKKEDQLKKKIAPCRNLSI